MKTEIYMKGGVVKFIPILITVFLISLVSLAVYQGLTSNRQIVVEKEVIVEKEIQLDPFTIKGDGYVLQKDSDPDDDDITIKITGKRMFEIALKIMDSDVERPGFSSWSMTIYLEKVTDEYVNIYVDAENFLALFDYLKKHKF